jgi:ribonuclease HII
MGSLKLLRMKNRFKFEESLYVKTECDYIIGTDEVGRGSLAGPVVAAAILFHMKQRSQRSKINYTDQWWSYIEDSKKVSSLQRASLANQIIGSNISTYAVTKVSAKIIDRINILQASLLAMKKSILKVLYQLSKELKGKSVYRVVVLVDGNQSIKNFSKVVMKEIEFHVQQICVVKGDEEIHSIAAASIVAKVNRDSMMIRLSKIYPYYGFHNNKGYGTVEHVKALKQFGSCMQHRETFIKRYSS